VAGYAAAVASAEPAPGGGSVVAVVAALGAALGEMVCRLTLEKVVEPGVEAELGRALAAAGDLRGRLLELSGRDEAAYGAYAAAVALPNRTEAEKRARREAREAALVGAAEVPLAVAEACLALAATLGPVARSGGRFLVSDVVVAARLAEAALHGALANVRANTRLMRDEERRARFDGRAAELEASGLGAVWAVLEVAAGR
jgi:glutamate formiminotransferase/formiminotetrahydrofolate cyclodeaminase